MTHTEIHVPSRQKIKKIINESDAKFRVLAEMTASAIFIFKGVIVLYVNPAAERLTGYTRQELLKMNLREIFTKDARKVIKSLGIQIQKDKSVSVRAEFKIITKNKEERWINLTETEIEFENKTAILGTAFDITEHKRAEVLQDAVYRIAQAADRSRRLDELFPAVHAIIAEVMNADNFYIALFDDESRQLSFPYYVDEVDTQPAPSQPGKGLTEYILRTGKSILVDIAVHDELINRGEIELVGNPSPIWLGVPLIVDSKVIGVMVVQHYSDANAYGEREKRILDFVSSQAAMVINRKRSEEALRESEKQYHRRADELTGLYETAQDLGSQKDLNTLLNIVADRVTSLIGSPGCSIYLFDKERQDLEAVISRGLPGLVGVRLQLGEGLAGKVAQTLQPTVIEDHRKWESRSVQFANLPTTAVAEVPMMCSGEFIGVLTVYEIDKGDGQPIRKYTQSDVDLLTVFSGTVAVAIENARLFEEARCRTIRQEALNAIITVSGRAGVNLDEILDTTLEQTLKAFGLDMGTIWLSWSLHGVQKMVSKNIPYPLNSLIANNLMSGVKPPTGIVVVNDWRNAKETYSDQFISMGIYSTVIVPLLSTENRIGGLTIASASVRNWTKEEIALVEAIGQEVGSVVERTKLFKETTSRLEELEVVYRVSASLRLAQSLKEMLPQLIDETLSTLEVEAGAIWLYNSDRGKLYQAIGRGWCTKTADLELDINEGLPGRIISTGDIYFSHDVAQDRFTSPTMRGFVPQGRSAIFLPIHSEQLPIGVIMASTTLPREFTAENARLLVTLTEIAGNAIHRTRLNDQLKDRAEELEERVTERTAELQSALLESQTADRLKSEFIANVNHELRTPLTNLILYYQMLRAQPNVKTDERLNVIGRELQRLRSLIEDLLNLSRFDLGQVTLHPLPCDLNVLIQTLVNDRRSLLEERGLNLEVNLQSSLGSVWLDEPTIIQALSNLLTNAMNYTPRGGRILVSTLTGKYVNEAWVGFRVEDTGRGIDNEDLPHLFERFYRGKAGHDSGTPGTGLGLAIVKQVVEHHQGRIDVENAGLGHGAVFTIWLPVKQPQEAS
jgi:PAS domain S-box-containing protein